MKNLVNNQNRVGDMSLQYYYEIATTTDATKRILWNNRRRFR